MRTAVIEISSGKVVNCIELEPGANWTPPTGCFVLASADAGPGDTWNGILFVKPPAPPTPPTLAEQLGVLAQPMVDQIKTMLNARNPAQPVTALEEAALKQKVVHLASRGQLPAQ